MKGPRFSNLDAMRGVCALSVVLFHCEGLFNPGEIFCHGFLAVDMFFILSGFVIAHTYDARLRDGLNTASFTRLRVKRLGPVYWVGTLLGAAMLVAVASFKPHGTFYSPAQIFGLSAMALALIPQLTLGGLAYPANAVAWSLMGELVVNVAYARWLHGRSTQVLLATVIALWAICAGYGFVNPRGWCFGADASDVILTPVRALPAFLAGVVLFRAHRAGWLARLPNVPPLGVLLAWVAIAQVPTFGATPVFDAIVVTLICPLLLALLVRAPDSAPKPLLWLGAISYPLYASHLALVFTARNTPLLGFQSGPDPLKAGLLILACIGVAWAIHRVVEQPAPKRQQTSSVAA